MAYFPNKTSTGGDGIWKLRDFSKYIQANNFPGIGNAIFGFGFDGLTNFGSNLNTITRFDNTGTYVGSEETAGTARHALAAASYGVDKAIFGFGYITARVNTITRFDHTGTYVGSEETAGTARNYPAAASYGGDKAIFGFGFQSNTITRFDNTGTYVGSEETAGTARYYLAAASYGGDKAIFGFGYSSLGGTFTRVNTITRFDNTGVYVGSEENAGTARYGLAAASYGGDKAIFGYGDTSALVNTITRFDNTGAYVGYEDTAGTARRYLAAASYG